MESHFAGCISRKVEKRVGGLEESALTPTHQIDRFAVAVVVDEDVLPYLLKALFVTVLSYSRMDT